MANSNPIAWEATGIKSIKSKLTPSIRFFMTIPPFF